MKSHVTVDFYSESKGRQEVFTPICRKRIKPSGQQTHLDERERRQIKSK